MRMRPKHQPTTMSRARLWQGLALTLVGDRAGGQFIQLVVDPAHTGRLRERPQGLLVVGVDAGVDPVEPDALEEVTRGSQTGLEREAPAQWSG